MTDLLDRAVENYRGLRFRHLKPSDRRWLQGGGIRKSPTKLVTLYAVKCRGYVKIGLSGNIKKRLEEFQGGCPFPIRLIAAELVPYQIATEAERHAHLILDKSFHFGEWFKCPASDGIYAVKMTAQKYAQWTPSASYKDG